MMQRKKEYFDQHCDPILKLAVGRELSHRCGVYASAETQAGGVL
jgi:hypothetical protein